MSFSRANDDQDLRVEGRLFHTNGGRSIATTLPKPFAKKFAAAMGMSFQDLLQCRVVWTLKEGKIIEEITPPQKRR